MARFVEMLWKIRMTARVVVLEWRFTLGWLQLTPTHKFMGPGIIDKMAPDIKVVNASRISMPQIFCAPLVCMVVVRFAAHLRCTLSNTVASFLLEAFCETL